jgi:hypothetical protein
MRRPERIEISSVVLTGTMAVLSLGEHRLAAKLP